MKEIISLTKLFINTNLGLSLIQYNRKNNKKAFLKQVGLPALVLVAMLPLYGLYVAYMAMMYTGMAAIGQESVLLPMAYTMISVVIIFFGLAYIMAEFYFSGGVEMLLPLPIKPRNIIIGKFGSIIFMEVLLSAALMLPPAVIYGMGQGMGILYYMMALIVIVILPVLPLALETLLIMLLMRSNSFKGKKDVFQIVALFAVLAFFLGLQMYLSSMAGGSDDPMAMVNSMLADNGYLLKEITRMYPVSLLVAQSLNRITLTGMLSLLGLLILTAAAFALMVFVGERVYVKGLISGKESGRGKKALSATKLQKALSHRSAPALAVFKMDMRLLLRTPIYFFNNVSIVVVVPLVFLMSMFFGKSGGMDIMTLVSDFYKAMPDAMNLILIMVFMFFGSTACTTATTFSREGKNIWLTCIVPVRPLDQMIGRGLSALCIQLLGIVFTLILLAFITPLTLGTVVISLVFGTIGSFPLLAFGLIVDMMRPLLNWDNPQKAVKNNMNVMIAMMVGWVYMLLVVGISAVTGFFIAPVFGYSFFAVVSIVISVLLLTVVKKHLEERMQMMDVE